MSVVMDIQLPSFSIPSLLSLLNDNIHLGELSIRETTPCYRPPLVSAAQYASVPKQIAVQYYIV